MRNSVFSCHADSGRHCERGDDHAEGWHKAQLDSKMATTFLQWSCWKAKRCAIES